MSKEIAKAGTLHVGIPAETKIDFGGQEAVTPEEQIGMIRSYIRSKVLRQFGIAELKRTPVPSGGLYLNDNRKQLSLPKVKTRLDGGFAENLEQYYARVYGDIRVFLIQAFQIANFTTEMVEEAMVVEGLKKEEAAK